MASQGKNKTNFKTYEASTRLLAAVIATNNIKLDYAGMLHFLRWLTCTLSPVAFSQHSPRTYLFESPSDPIVSLSVELARHVGNGATKDSINHRLRPIKQLAKMQAACLQRGEDPGDLPADKGGNTLQVLSQHVLYLLLDCLFRLSVAPLPVWFGGPPSVVS